MRIHFYKARAGKLGDKVVGIASIFSHVELEINGVCYSSSNRDKGVRSKVIDTSNAQKWLSFDLKKNIDENICLSYFKSVEGQQYDWLNIFFSQTIKSKGLAAIASFITLTRFGLTPVIVLSERLLKLYILITPF